MIKRICIIALCICIGMSSVSLAQQLDVQSNTNPEVNLTIYSLPTYCTLFDYAIESFEESHPGITIQVQEMEADMLREAIYADHAEADLFILPSNGVVYDWLITAGKIALLDSDILLNDTKSMYPQIQEYVLREGSIYGYPLYTRVQYSAIDYELLQSIGWDSRPLTWDAYLDVMQCWYEREMHLSENLSFSHAIDSKMEFYHAFTSLLISCINSYRSPHEVSFETSAFRTLLAKLQFLKQFDSQSRGESTPEVRQLFPSPFLTPIRTREENYILPPVFFEGDTPVVNAYLDFWVVSGTSEHPELAMAFLEHFCLNRNMANGFELYPYQVSIIEDSAEAYGIPLNAFETHRLQMAHTRFSQSDLIGALYRNEQIDELAMQYYDGIVTEDEVIEKLTAYLHKVLTSPEFIITNEWR